jgi:hypothetical protein
MQQEIYKDFRDATVALLKCGDLPKGVSNAVDAMIDQFNNELGGNDEPTEVNAYRVMSKVFGLNGHAPVDDDDEADDRLQLVCRLLDEIERRDDYRVQFARLKRKMIELAYEDTNGEDE